MATQKKTGGDKSKNNVGIGGNFRGSVRSIPDVANDKKRDDENIPWSLLITVMAVVLTFFIVMPILGFMYFDLWYLKQAATVEIKKMKELRRDILTERMYRND